MEMRPIGTLAILKAPSGRSCRWSGARRLPIQVAAFSRFISSTVVRNLGYPRAFDNTVTIKQISDILVGPGSLVLQNRLLPHRSTGCLLRGQGACLRGG